MLLIIGVVIVFGSVVGGYVMDHGQLAALWQPTELLIIGGASVGAFVTSNPPAVVNAALKGVSSLMGGPQYKRQDYVDLLSLLFDLLIKVRKEGLMSLEEHVDNPGESPLFTAYPRLMKEHHLIDFKTDCLRLMVGGGMNPMELEQLLDTELETHHSDGMAPALALQKMADALPGFGIVAAVLGIVTTMSSIGSGDVATIGSHVAAALVGTFLGILLAYGLVGPLSAALEYRANDDSKPFEVTKIALVASLRGYNPQVAIEFARKSLAVKVRPSFPDLEAH
ncbi:MAG TPA: flagellar motor stator protein MotA, partial [Mizugakiibacter sp.]|nr:flagellar motor stator protein MotA [Mizugakiibacter sp.]